MTKNVISGEPSQVDADVIIVGAGPCGTTLANLLGIYGVRALVIERETDVIDFPRGVGIDDEAMRCFQTAGIADELANDMVQNAIVRYHHSNGKCFAQISPKDAPFGWPRRNMFIQPLTERAIRKGLRRFEHTQLMLGTELQTLDQDAGGVSVGVRDATGEKKLSARYLVGADGGRSTTRKLVGIDLEGVTHAWRWLVIDLKHDDRFEPFSGVYCDPHRPYMSIDLPYGHRRYEFRLLQDETDEEMSRPEAALRLLEGKIPKGQAPEIIRSRIYTHHSRIADRFQERRVFLAGDAAHLQPPFFGQGLNSGLRDVMNLSWKLAMVIQGKAHQSLLASYNTERRHHATTMVNFATAIGKFYAPKSYFTEVFRKLFFRAVQKLPAARDYVLQMKFKPLPHYSEGVVVAGAKNSSLLGRMFVQPQVQDRDGKILKLDDAIGNGFAVLGLNQDPAARLGVEMRRYIADIGGAVVQINRSRRSPDLYSASPGTIVLDDVSGAFRDMMLARPSDEFIVLRPDRYVAAVCSGSGLLASLQRLRALLRGEPVD